MVLRLLAANAEHWLAHRLNAYLRDNDEYRAITRNLLHLGGTIAYTPATVTVTLDTPASPRIMQALACSSTNSPPPRRGSPATRGPSPTSSRRTPGFNHWTPTGFVDTIRSGTMVYEERTGSGTGSQEVHPGI